MSNPKHVTDDVEYRRWMTIGELQEQLKIVSYDAIYVCEAYKLQMEKNRKDAETYEAALESIVKFLDPTRQPGTMLLTHEHIDEAAVRLVTELVNSKK